MFLAACLDLGVDRERLLAQLRSLGLPGWRWTIESTSRRQLACTKVDFEIPEDKDHRHLPEILAFIEGSDLSERAKEKAAAAFTALAIAEAKAHGIDVERVHFHEVGAADAILDICGVSAALDMLGVDELFCGPLPAGSGTVRCAHGEMPVPVPAVVNLLGDFELQLGVGRGEMVTPTGAALLVAWGAPATQALALKGARSGYGAGTRESSICRLTLGEAQASEGAWERDEVWELRFAVDDISGEALAFGLEQLFSAGAVDAYATPIVMKKGRPAHELTVLCRDAHKQGVTAACFEHLGTIGLRESKVARAVLPRELIEVETPWGKVRVKVANGLSRPEFEDCAALAREHKVALERVYEEAKRAAASR
jgi:uncharacterized protein (TIGR00299 family) protein